MGITVLGITGFILDLAGWYSAGSMGRVVDVGRSVAGQLRKWLRVGGECMSKSSKYAAITSDSQCVRPYPTPPT